MGVKSVVSFAGITREAHDAIPHTSAMIADETLMDVDINPIAAIGWGKIAHPRPLRLMADITTTADADFIDTGHILNINRDGLYQIVFSTRNAGTLDTHYSLFVEGDFSMVNYSAQTIFASGASLSASRHGGPIIGWVPIGGQGTSVLWLVRDPAGFPRFLSIFNRRTGAAQEFEINVGNRHHSVPNITHLRFGAHTGWGIGAGTRIQIFGAPT